jgi:acyl carrier protein
MVGQSGIMMSRLPPKLMTSNLAKYTESFKIAFDLPPDSDPSTLIYQAIDNWDSVGHMSLMSELEDTFDIVLEMDDIIDFSSFSKGLEILTKYGVTFDQ